MGCWIDNEQLDIRGNPYGILAAHPIAPLVSLHHLDYVQSIFPAMTQPDSLKKLYKAYETDPSRALQHSFCYDTVRNWSVSVSWGYSVQLYPWLVTAKEMETAFLTYQTWKTNSNEPFTFDTQPVSSDPCKRPILYFLNSTERLGSRQWRTLTTYQRYTEEARCDRPDYAPALAVESFNVSAPEFDRRLWNQVKNNIQTYIFLMRLNFIIVLLLRFLVVIKFSTHTIFSEFSLENIEFQLIDLNHYWMSRHHEDNVVMWFMIKIA